MSVAPPSAPRLGVDARLAEGDAVASSSAVAASSGALAFGASSEPVGDVIKGRFLPKEYPKLYIAATTKIGRRKKQEDRCTIVPRAFGRDDIQFFGVFDGTVGDNAADFVHHVISDNVLGSKAFADGIALAASDRLGFCRAEAAASIANAVAEGYRSTDGELLEMCAKHGIDYSSCTSVTAVVAGDLLTVAHLGDSKIVLGREGVPGSGVLVGKYLTTDHKPDMIEERARIEKSGGSLAYLHGGKPFIRGGDFTERQARGERPMQLNYSRAFGGKDLKPYGLLAIPDIAQHQITRADKILILASDGLWDVATADVAVKRGYEAYRAGRDPSADLTDFALEQHDLRATIDNVTVIVVVFHAVTGGPAGAGGLGGASAAAAAAGSSTGSGATVYHSHASAAAAPGGAAAAAGASTAGGGAHHGHHGHGHGHGHGASAAAGGGSSGGAAATGAATTA